MEQMEPIADTESASLPVMKVEPRYDSQRAGIRKVRVIKVPYEQDPMKEQTVFEFGGFVYICYAKKTRGRAMIRCLGLADVERPPNESIKDEAVAISDNAVAEAGNG